MDWYYAAVVILGVLNFAQFVVFFYLKSQEKIVKERHDGVIDRLNKLEHKHELFNKSMLEMDAFLRYGLGRDINVDR